MSSPVVNGERSQSQVISHISSYPFVAQSVDLYSSNPLGAKSIDILRTLYARFAAPLMPYLQGPYSVIAPYVAAADNIGNQGLDTVDNKFPAIKKTELTTLKSNAMGFAAIPFKLADDGKNYIFSTYNDEYKKVGGQGVVTTGKAMLSTELRIAHESYQKFWGVVGPKVEKAKKTGIEKGQEVQEKVNEQVNGN